MIGVYSDVIGKLYKSVLLQTKSNFAIVHAIDGYDEISLTAETKISTKKKDLLYTPKAFGMDIIQPHEIHGGDSIETNKSIFTNILNGKGTTAQNNVVIANAALGISLYYDQTLEESVALATDSLLSLKALSSLQKLTKN
jgi:anthranilate phosphoribosyltransferase